MAEMTYTQNGDYLIPNISHPETKVTYGKYGMMREDYLKQHRMGLWNRLILKGELTQHLCEIDTVARERIDLMMPQLMKDAGITEELKMTDQMKWVGLMNSCKAQAEEIVQNELIYS